MNVSGFAAASIANPGLRTLLLQLCDAGGSPALLYRGRDVLKAQLDQLQPVLLNCSRQQQSYAIPYETIRGKWFFIKNIDTISSSFRMTCVRVRCARADACVCGCRCVCVQLRVGGPYCVGFGEIL